MASTKPKRRFFQFSLRTFLILMTLFAIWFGWAMHKARQQKKAVAWVEEMGGSIWYEYEVDEDGEHIFDAEPSGPGWWRDILGVDFLSDVVFVNLNDSEVTDLTPLAGLNNLHGLSLDRTPINDLTLLAGLKNLQLLCLRHTQVSDLTPLAGLKSLQELFLSGTQVSDLTPLSGINNLSMLGIPYTEVTDLTPLAGLKNLQSLLLTSTSVNRQQAATLEQALPNCNIGWMLP